MLSIGLTGGIGSGKSTVADLFAKLGIDIIDTDLIARSVVEPGTKALRDIAAHFGKEVLNSDQTLNRKMLAKKIFNNLEEKSWLEKLLHPLINEEVLAAKAKVKSPYCIIVIPLLIETLPNPTIDRILVVDSPQSLQISRTVARDQRSESEITAIIDTQAAPEERLKAADDLIINDRGLAELTEAVLHLHHQYLKLCDK
jgi:dephospho-CoA kinase